MSPYISIESRRGTTLAGVAIWVMFAALSSGCVALFVGAAGGAAGTVYVMGKLTEELRYDVPVVHGAAQAAMKELGLALSEDRADTLSAHLRQSETVHTDLAWLKRAFWTLAGTGVAGVSAAVVSLMTYFLNH